MPVVCGTHVSPPSKPISTTSKRSPQPKPQCRHKVLPRSRSVETVGARCDPDKLDININYTSMNSDFPISIDLICIHMPTPHNGFSPPGLPALWPPQQHGVLPHGRRWWEWSSELARWTNLTGYTPCALPETNVAENWWLEDEFPFGMQLLQVPCWFQGGYLLRFGVLTTCRTRSRVCRAALREETTRCSQWKTAGAETDQLERANTSITNVLKRFKKLLAKPARILSRRHRPRKSLRTEKLVGS